MRFLVCIALCLAAAIASAQTPAAPESAAADFANLARYRDADVAEHNARVVFLGDSITDYWGKRGGAWFTTPGWLNRGIGGQTTSQLLLRTRQDVIALRPRVLIIEGGSNDMRLGFPA